MRISRGTWSDRWSWLYASLLLAAACGPPSSDAGAEAAARDTVTSADGVRIAYEVHGAGSPALVFVHGWSCDRAYWGAQVGPFSRDFRVVTLDLAGHGASGLDRDAWTVEAFGADVAAVVDRLALQRFILIGHSLGGDVILEAARRLPGRVEALVWVDTYRSLDSPWTVQEIQDFVAPFRADFRASTLRFVRSIFPPDVDEELVQRVAADMASAPPEIAVDVMERSFRYGREVTDVLRELDLPLVAINAEEPADLPTDVSSLERHGVEVVRMAGVGHFLMMEDPERFNALLRAEIDRHLAPTAAQEPPERRFFDSDGVRLHYIDEGSGEPVLLIHGLAVNLELNWLEPGIAAALLEHGYRVIAYDARGHGRSEKPYDSSRYGAAEIDDPVRLLDHLGISRAHVVGYSRGARVAHRLRARHPGRLRTVTLGGYGEVAGGAERAFAVSPQLADSMEAGRFGPLIRAVNPDAPDEEAEVIARMVAELNDGRAVAAAYRADPGFPPLDADELRDNEIPTLALIGEHDRFAAQVREMSEVMGALEVLVVPEANHVSAFRRPEFVTALIGFMAKHPIDPQAKTVSSLRADPDSGAH